MDKLRRDLLKLAIQVPFLSSPFLGMNPLNFSVEEYLAQCRIAVRDSWKLMAGKFLAVAENMLSAHVNPLMQIVYSTSPFKREAAAIATQAKIVQAILTTHRLDFAARKLHCLEAVACARISQNPRLLAAALYYLSSTYTFCSIPPQPDHALPILQEALQYLDGDEPLLSSVLHCGLATAQAQSGNELMALERLDKTRALFPSSPERDPNFEYLDHCDKAGHLLRVGKVFLELARHFPAQDYYDQAQGAFERSIALGAMADRNTSETLIRRGAAAVGLGDLELYEASLRKGLILAKEVGSQKRLIEAHAIFQDTPQAWQTDRRIKELEEEFFLPSQLPKQFSNVW